MDQLLTSFGPYGKAKIIYGDSGTAQLTKDGKAILEALHTVHGSCSIDSLSRLRCISIGSSLGDGTITAAILLGNLLESIDRYGPHGRVKLLQSFQIVRRILSGNVAEIMKCISRSYGFLVDDPKRLVEIIVRNIVAPSSSLEAAQKLSELMVGTFFTDAILLNQYSYCFS